MPGSLPQRHVHQSDDVDPGRTLPEIDARDFPSVALATAVSAGAGAAHRPHADLGALASGPGPGEVKLGNHALVMEPPGSPLGCSLLIAIQN